MKPVNSHQGGATPLFFYFFFSFRSRWPHNGSGYSLGTEAGLLLKGTGQQVAAEPGFTVLGFLCSAA